MHQCFMTDDGHDLLELNVYFDLLIVAGNLPS